MIFEHKEQLNASFKCIDEPKTIRMQFSTGNRVVKINSNLELEI